MEEYPPASLKRLIRRRLDEQKEFFHKGEFERLKRLIRRRLDEPIGRQRMLAALS